MPIQAPKRGAIPSPKAAIAAAKPHVAKATAPPPTSITLPKPISWWGNNEHGDCVTAEEAFAKACNTPEIYLSDSTVTAWAARHGVLEGAVIVQVLQWMQNDGFQEGGLHYEDGQYFSVNWSDPGTLHSAISNGPVKIGVAADQLETAWQTTSGNWGWFATGFQPDARVDHCPSLCGYGTIDWLARQLHVGVPQGIEGTKNGYALFTWNSIGIIDEPSLLAITHEAWLRQPTTVVWDLRVAEHLGAVFAPQRSHVEVLFQRRDGHPHYFYVENKSWQNDGRSFDAAGVIYALDAVFEVQRNHTSFFVKGQDEYLHFFYVQNAAWRHDGTSFKALYPGQIEGPISAVFETQRNHCSVFVKGQDGYLHFFYVQNAAWQHDSASFQ